MLTRVSTTVTFFTFHLNLFHLTLDINFSHHFSTTPTRVTFMQNSRNITCAFTMFAYLSPSETIKTWPASIKSRQWNRHLRSKISTFGFGSFLNLPQSLFPKQVISIPFRHINKRLIRSFNLQKLLLYIFITSIPIRMILDR